MQLEEIPGSYCILRYPAKTVIPAWIQQSNFYSITKTADELSIVCSSDIPEEYTENCELGWKCIRVAEQLDFSLTGVLSSLSEPLAKAKISIFAISTFNTDYILIKEQDLKKAKEALSDAGFEFL